MITRWYLIGKSRFEAELNIEKMLKTIRSLKIHTNFTREEKASILLRDKNVIEIDSDEHSKKEIGDKLKKCIASAVERNKGEDLSNLLNS